MTIATDQGIPERYCGNTEQRETKRIREGFPEEVPFNYLIFFFCFQYALMHITYYDKQCKRWYGGKCLTDSSLGKMYIFTYIHIYMHLL